LSHALENQSDSIILFVIRSKPVVGIPASLLRKASVWATDVVWVLVEGEYSIPEKNFGVRIYGVSASTVKAEIETLTGVNPGRKAVKTKETGRVSVTPEIYSSAKYADCCSGGGGGGGGDGGACLFCFILVVAFMAVIAIVWAVVMLAFSILTIGGFLKRRYRTLLVMEMRNREFIGKLAVSTFRKGGIMEYPFGHDQYDSWMKRAFALFVRLKHIRQISLLFATFWGFTEVAFKLNQVLLNPSLNYDLWPLRYVMMAIIIPLLLYSPILEIQFRNSRDTGEEMITRLLTENPSFSPDTAMVFEEEPKLTALLPAPRQAKKKK
jgi:hypothetical protein